MEGPRLERMQVFGLAMLVIIGIGLLVVALVSIVVLGARRPDRLKRLVDEIRGRGGTASATVTAKDAAGNVSTAVRSVVVSAATPPPPPPPPATTYATQEYVDALLARIRVALRRPAGRR